MSDPAQQNLPLGYHLEEFEIIRVLGSGGFGITYLARDHSLDREVVIKENLPLFAFRDPSTSTVHPKTSKGEDTDLFAWSLESFVREARTLAKFDHPNIVKILRVFHANGTAYFVMPYVEGETFSEWIAERKKTGGTFAEDELRALLLPLLDALEVLHGKQVYHRDIKPGNVLVTSRGTPMLIDFGAARQMVSERSHTVVESPGYTPFEQLQSRGNVGPWSDLYGLAATFYKALTFENPPKANDRVKKDAIRRLGEDSELRASFSRKLLTSLDVALAFDEEARPQTAGEMVRLLEESRVAEEGKVDEPAEDEAEDEAEELVGLGMGSLFGGNEEAGEQYNPEKIPVEAPSVRVEEESAREKIAAFEAGEHAWRKRIGLGNQEWKREESSERRGRRNLTVIGVLGVVLLVGVVINGMRPNHGGGVPVPEDQTLRSSPSPVEAAPPAPAPAFSTSHGMEGSRAGEMREFGGIEMVWCPPGGFLIGSPVDEEGRDDDETEHRVTLTKGFWMAKTETTQGQWEGITGENPSNFKGDDLPVERVSWDDVQGWLTKMNSQNALPSGWKWVLPSEAQWEYACRAGTTTMVAGDLGEMAWYTDNSGGITNPVGTKKANAWGLHDMHGNVWEWCADGYGDYESGSATDPTGGTSGSIRVRRGGSWSSNAVLCRSADRLWFTPGYRDVILGFRVAAVPAGQTSGLMNQEIADPADASPSSQSAKDLLTATREAPFVNSLGMEFLPVPGNEGVYMARTETRVRDFRAFAQATHFVQTGGALVAKVTPSGSKWELDDEASWENPGFSQSEDHPVVCVSWDEARTFCAWLTKQEPGLTYRLPRDAEWTSAVEIGGIYPWGDTWPPPEGVGNYFGKEAPKSWPGSKWDTLYDYDDRAQKTAPVAMYDENCFGFFDLGGNVYEWCEDEYRASMNDADLLSKIPALKIEKHSDGTQLRVMRGGSWYDNAEVSLRSLCRLCDHPKFRRGSRGFRLVVEKDSNQASFWDQSPSTQLLALVRNHPETTRTQLSEFLTRNAFESDNKATFSKNFETFFTLGENTTLKGPLLVFESDRLVAIVQNAKAAEAFIELAPILSNDAASPTITVSFLISHRSVLAEEIRKTFGKVFGK